MKILNPLNNYATNHVDLILRDSLNLPISIADGDVPVLVCKRSLRSSTQLFRVVGTVLDSTNGHVHFEISYIDSTHDAGPVVLEARVSGGGKESVVGQFESYLAQSLSIPSFHNSDYSPRYNTHVMFTGTVLSEIDQSLLSEFDLIFVDSQSYYYLEDQYKDKAVIMFDIWSHERYLPEPSTPYDAIIQTPGELSVPSVQNSDGRYLYEMTDGWMYQVYVSANQFCLNYGNRLKGVCVQNYYPDMGTQWFLGNGDDLIVWGDRTDGAGDLVPEFFKDNLETLESYLTTVVNTHIQDGILVLGGTVRNLSGSFRMAENTCVSGPTGHEELLNRLEDDGNTYPDHYAQSGDFIQVSPYDSTGVFGQWVDNDYGDGGVNFVRASYLAANRGCSLGVAYGELPLSGYSKYSLIVDPKTPRWYNY